MRLVNLLAVFFLLAAWPAAGANESCVECHTDESILESLVTAPRVEAPVGIGPSGAPPAVSSSKYHTNFLVHKTILDSDPHFGGGCTSCHKGDATSIDQEKAHKGVVKKPSRDLQVCGDCHEDIAKAYGNTLHYTAQGMLNKMSGRLSKTEGRIFTEKVFEQSCRSCHASCGDCHVQSPSRNGIRAGFIDKHRFVKKDEGKTCAVCHGGRVYPEYTGEHSGIPDVHYQKGMTCTTCHQKRQIHGTAGAGAGKNDTGAGPQCRDCHKTGREKQPTARLAHAKHEGKVSCYGCHTQGSYRNCYNCHKGRASTSELSFILGADPKDKRTLTTLRAIPLARDSFVDWGITMERFDEVPDYRAAPVHNIRKSTDRTRSCDTCHVARKGFLSKKSILKNGSKANEGLIFKMGPPSIN
jgi:hypothetical protein